MRTLGGFLLGLVALATCPCHLLVTIPLLIAALAGTPLGPWLSSHPYWLFLVVPAIFSLSLVGAIRLFSPARVAPVDADRPGERVPDSGDRCCQPRSEASLASPAGGERR